MEMFLAYDAPSIAFAQLAVKWEHDTCSNLDKIPNSILARNNVSKSQF